MLGITVLLLLVCLVAAVLGAMATGLFSLALISLALLLGTGAVGLTVRRPRGAAGESEPDRQQAAVAQLSSRRRAQGGGELRRAA